MLTNEKTIDDAIKVRTWLLKLERGDKVTIIPGSHDHATMKKLIDYVEVGMAKTLRASATKKRPRVSTNKGTLAVHKVRDKKKQRVLGLLSKYMEIHHGMKQE